MSDQGDAGQWHPATSQSDQQHSTPDDTTGPLPAIPRDKADEPGFPPVSAASGMPSGAASGPGGSHSAADDDDAPTGGFPAVSVPEEVPAQEPTARAERSPFEPFEPADRTDEPQESYESPAPRPPEFGDPGPSGATPRFGTDILDPDPDPDPEPEVSGSSFGSFRSFSSFDPGAFEDKPDDEGPYVSGPNETKPYNMYDTQDAKPYDGPEGSWGPGTFSAESPAEGVSSTAGSFGLPQKTGVTAEDEAAENEFFAPDDHPPMWDKVVAPAGPPPKPGKPSSGNLRLPEWMRDEMAGANGTLSGPGNASDYEEEGRSKRPLFIGLGVLLAGLLAAGAVYVLKGHGDSQASNDAAPSQTTQAPSTAPTQPAPKKPPARKPLPHFKGVHTKAAGRISDSRSGLSYARLTKPWMAPPENSPMNEIGFSASQFAVTEKAGGKPKHWARLMSAQLSGAAKGSYNGPGTEPAAATDLARIYEARMFSFRHRKRLLASQPLNLGGHRGWLVSDYVTYKRPGLKATGDLVAVALVDTGKKTPGVLFMSVPNTDRKLWPDVNFIVHSLKVA